MSLCALWILIISQYTVKFDGQRPYGSEEIFFICHVFPCDNVINGLYDFVDNSPFPVKCGSHRPCGSCSMMFFHLLHLDLAM